MRPSARSPFFVPVLALVLSSGDPSPLVAQPGDVVPLADYRQQRPELPGGGSMYCGPAATTDLLHWLHQHGYPLIAAPAEEDQGCDPEVEGDLALSATIFIESLGEEMGTDAVGGTNSRRIVETLQARLDAAYPGRFTVGFEGRFSEDEASRARGQNFATIVDRLEVGDLVAVNIGWYVVDGTETVEAGTRCGGHFVAMTGYDDPTPDDTSYTARFADPARDCQAVTTREVSRRTLTLEYPDDEYLTRSVSSWNWERNANACSGEAKRYGFQDSVIHVSGTCLFSVSPTQIAIECLDLSQLNVTAPTLYPTPLKVDCVAVHPSLLSIWSCAGGNVVQCTEIASGRTYEVPMQPRLTAVQEMLFGPDSTLYLLDVPPGGAPPLVHAVDARGRLIRTVTPAGNAVAMAFHEGTNLLLLFDAAKTEIVVSSNRLGELLGTVPVSSLAGHSLPLHMAADPVLAVVYFNHEGSSSIFPIDFVTGKPRGELSARDLRNPGPMAVDNSGRLFVATEGGGPVLTFLDGALEARQVARGYIAGRGLALARASRRPLIERSTPGELNNDPPIEDDPRPALRGDCNGDGGIDISDGIFDLNRLFTGGRSAPCPDACDSNDDGASDISDGIYLLAHLFLGGKAPPATPPRCPGR